MLTTSVDYRLLLCSPLLFLGDICAFFLSPSNQPPPLSSSYESS